MFAHQVARQYDTEFLSKHQRLERRPRHTECEMQPRWYEFVRLLVEIRIKFTCLLKIAHWPNKWLDTKTRTSATYCAIQLKGFNLYCTLRSNRRSRNQALTSQGNWHTALTYVRNRNNMSICMYFRYNIYHVEMGITYRMHWLQVFQ